MQADFLTDALAVAATRLLEQRLVTQIKIQQPAAGAEFTVTVPGGELWEVIAVNATLVCSAAVATRAPELLVQDADNFVWRRYDSENGTGANSTRWFAWEAGYGYASSNPDFVNGLPSVPIIAPNGTTIKSLTGSIQAADQWTKPCLTVRTWSESDIVQEMAELLETFEAITSRMVAGK